MATHGHLDHTLNIREIVERSGAKVYGHGGDNEHFVGRYRYRGWSRICGCLEWMGRLLFGFQGVELDLEIENEEILDLWGGLRVVHLPGHTRGHCGFYSERVGILFAGDLFANGRLGAMEPWFFLNTCAQYFEGSFEKVLELDPRGMLGNHCDGADAGEQKRRFVAKFGKKKGE